MSFPVSKSPMMAMRSGGSKNKAMRPQLTSLIDVMTILLIYLLKSFSAEGEIITSSKNLILPSSTATKKPKTTVVVKVSTEHIVVEGEILALVDKVNQTDELDIPGLGQWLRTRRQTTEQIEQYSSTTKFTGDITIQGDKRIPFGLLKKIMYTCGQQGFNNFSLAVQKKEG